MKKQDLMTLLGVVAGIILLLWGMSLGGSKLKIFYDFPSIIITGFGSFCSLLINYPFREVSKLGSIIIESFKELKSSKIDMIERFSSLSKKARREGLLSLEDEVSNIEDDYLKKGLQMVIDGIEPETIREIMELEIGEMEKRHKIGIDMLKSWAAYAPAFGMIGTLIGLIQMLDGLDDSSKIASGMAVALITTFYGAVMANLIFTPMAAKLALRSEKESGLNEMLLEGILAIQSGVNPRIVEEKLICYLSPEERKKYGEVTKLQEGVA
ncbi:motility protein A [Desnuesiella massiliensis]|uniref:motility protein A n=1 Tax=Desnuesiella massiliensis TaxID=1650662 RepID=UPI0006E1BEF0|nr:motility protein A [Desnuesiella massiliensis]